MTDLVEVTPMTTVDALWVLQPEFMALLMAYGRGGPLRAALPRWRAERVSTAGWGTCRLHPAGFMVHVKPECGCR